MPELGECVRCGRPQDDADGWLYFEMRVSAGQREPARWSVVPTRSTGALCWACISGPGGEAVRAVLSDPWAVPIGQAPAPQVQQRCSVVCMHPWPRWRRRLHLTHRGTPYVTRCPHCHDWADLAALADVITTQEYDDDEPEDDGDDLLYRIRHYWDRRGLPPDNDPRPVPQEAGRGTIEPPQTLQE